MPQSRNLVARIFATLFVAEFALLYCAELFLRSGPFISRLFYLGLDYRYFYAAGGAWLSGANPYADPRFTSPAPAVLFGATLHWLPFDRAAAVFVTLSAIALIISVYLLGRALQLNRADFLDLFLIAATFCPVHALLTGGNTDAFILLLLVLAYSTRSRWLSYVLAGASAGFKAYTGLIAVVLFRKRQWIAAAVLAATVVLLFAPFFHLLPAQFARLGNRTGEYRVIGNVSPAVLFLSPLPDHPRAAKLAYLFFWVGTLLITLLRDRSRPGRHSFVAYIPWMIAAPTLVLRYVGVILLPVFARLIRFSRERALSLGEWFMVAGLIVSNLYPYAFAQILPFTPERSDSLRLVMEPIGALGVALLLLGAAASPAWTEPLPSELD